MHCNWLRQFLLQSNTQGASPRGFAPCAPVRKALWPRGLGLASCGFICIAPGASPPCLGARALWARCTRTQEKENQSKKRALWALALGLLVPGPLAQGHKLIWTQGTLRCLVHRARGRGPLCLQHNKGLGPRGPALVQGQWMQGTLRCPGI